MSKTTRGAKKTARTTLHFNRMDVYRLRGEAFLSALASQIEETLPDGPTGPAWKRLNPAQQGVYAWVRFVNETNNGGLSQFYYNCGEAVAEPLPGFFKTVGQAPLATLVQAASKFYRDHRAEFDTAEPFGEGNLFDRMTRTELAKLERACARLFLRTGKLVEAWVRKNFARLGPGDDGQPVDMKFTGVLETFHANGQLWEKGEIRKGLLSGPYQRYGEDGSLQESSYYKGGEPSADFWPNGQVRHKKRKQGKLKIYEWYFPSGALQKRLVANSSGDGVQPVQLWHENGQLAEELHMKNGKKLGPWRKFFADGSPRLEAEHGLDEALVVRNAWDNDGKQVVKNGTGVYFDDGVEIDTEYEAFRQSNWTSSKTLRAGVLHGPYRGWRDGRLHGDRQYVNGKLHGVCRGYYNNGRVRTETTYQHGKQVKEREFPKFDRPEPVAVLTTEANDKLYTAWRRPLLQSYATPKNLAQIQRKIHPPAFLLELFAQYQQDPASLDDYDHPNSFDESVTYFVIVDEKGKVTQVSWSGCGVRSGGTIEDYIPLIHQLQFKPAKLNGNPVACVVLVQAHHTYAEGGAKR